MPKFPTSGNIKIVEWNEAVLDLTKKLNVPTRDMGLAVSSREIIEGENCSEEDIGVKKDQVLPSQDGEKINNLKKDDSNSLLPRYSKKSDEIRPNRDTFESAPLAQFDDENIPELPIDDDKTNKHNMFLELFLQFIDFLKITLLLLTVEVIVNS
ncbi:unnamed protein product [Ceutorhynchus assimilis]|uniref:Uncharacterized protein n=1 Tax=Ceutorhynchus assimilis TaxID=467358 RepID=A0A9N9N1G8_9CUCU|nr:unnamed protein product [Ceutorhynchus assimilis]